MPDLRRRFGSLVALSGAATVAGFATQVLVAFHFGTTAALDAYWLALAVATALSFYVHPLRESLISVVFRAVRSHEDRASETLTAGVLLLLAMSLLAALALWISSRYELFAHGAITDAHFGNLLLALLPFIFLFALSETFNAVLLSLDLALHQAWARLLSALCAVACVGLLGGALGIYAMVISLLAGQAVVLIVSWRTLSSRGLRWRWVGLSPLRDRAFLLMFGSLLLNYLLAQAYVFTERWTMSALQSGALSAFQYATLLVNVMISLLALPLSNLLWPRFLELERQGDRLGMVTLAWNTGAPVVFVLLALATFTWHAAPEVVSLVFERGRFDADSQRQTVAALQLTVFAAVPIALVTLALRALMSQNQSGRVAAVGVMMALIGLTVLGLAWLSRSLPLAQAHWMVANACGAALAWIWLLREANTPRAEGARMLRSAALSILVVTLPLLLMPQLDVGRAPWQMITSLVGEGLIYGALVCSLALACRLVSTTELLRRLRLR
jgi:putative peptidoglycan lipid II flippase